MRTGNRQWWYETLGLLALAIGALCVISMLGAILLGCAGQQTAQKAAVEHDARTCDDKAVAIIKASKTCEDAVSGLNEMVKRDRDCANVFHASDPVQTCKGQGVQR
jgi:hypothetical protein